MNFYAFKYNKETSSIELGDTGKVVAKRDPRISNMFIPDVDPSIGAKLALHVLNGINRVHDIQFGSGETAAKLLMEADFSEPKKQNLVHDTHNIEYNEYTDTLRVKETNHLLMKRVGSDWEFDFDGGAPEALVQRAYLRFYQDPALKQAEPEALVKVLSVGQERKLDNSSLEM